MMERVRLPSHRTEAQVPKRRNQQNTRSSIPSNSDFLAPQKQTSEQTVPYSSESRPEAWSAGGLTPLSHGAGASAMGGPIQAKKNEEQEQLGTLEKEDIEGTNSDIQRLAFKKNLMQNAQMDLDSGGISGNFKGTLQKIQAYCMMDVTAAQSGGVRKEAALQQTIMGELDEQIQALMVAKSFNQQKQKELDTLLMYQNYFAMDSRGYLDVSEQGERMEEGDTEIKTGLKFMGISIDGTRDASEEPLFPHEPSMLDIQQGGLGDCYLLAALAAMVDANPQRIKDCMRDNGDTVTVRFFEKDGNGTVNKKFVTVNKRVPKTDQYASGCLWAQLIERAYTFSGLHQSGNDPARYKKQGWKPSYKDIEGGQTQNFLFVLTGKDSVTESPLGDRGEVKTGSKEMPDAFDVFSKQYMAFGQQGPRYATITQYLFELQSPAPQSQEEKELYDADADFMQKWDELQNPNLKTGTVKKEDGSMVSQEYREKTMTREEANQLVMTMELSDAFLKDDPTLSAEQNEAAKKEKSRRAKERIFALIEPHMSLQYESFSGKYTDKAVETYEHIEKATESGTIMTGGTHKFIPEGLQAAEGRNGEQTAKGLVEGHAYSILGVVTQGGNRFVKMRNPWGSTIAGYFQDAETNAVNRKKMGGDSEGIFLLELNEFMDTFDTLAFT